MFTNWQQIQTMALLTIVLCSLVVPTFQLDFQKAMQIVKSHSVVMDIKDHEMPVSKLLVNDVITQSQMSEMEEDHVEAVKMALHWIEKLSRNLNSSYPYRRADGLGNNIMNPRWGAAFHFENRLLPASYRDGVELPRTVAKSGDPLPSARNVSVKCFLPSEEEKPFFDRETSQLFTQLGQFLDHEIIATSLSVAFNCCSDTRPMNISKEEPCFTIPIEKGDRFFNNSCMNFRRAYGVKINGVREQLSTTPSFVDLSVIYGSTEDEAASMRQFQQGLLKMSAGNMLPFRDFYPCVKRNIPACPVSGDSRVSEVAGLSALHTIYHREHNRIALKLAEVNPHWDDERLYQEARKINIGQHQRITYYEFLPRLLGHEVMEKLGINRHYCYDPTLNPSVINEFGGAAYRFGHTLVSSLQYFKRKVSLPLSEVFFRPETTLYHGEGPLRDVIQSQSRHLAHKFDSYFTREIADKLYLGVDMEAEPGESFDLLARNIQRGRDHGIGPYVDYFDYSLGRLQGICGVGQYTLPICLNTGVYQSISDVDIFAGGVAETPLTGAIVGPTFAAIIGEQFYRLKHGDRFFFETPDRSIGFTPDQLAEIHDTAILSAIICRNTIVKKIQPRALESRRSPDNKKLPCSEYPDINFELWRE